MSIGAIALVRAASPPIHSATATAGWETGLAVAVAIFLFWTVLAITIFGSVRQSRGRGRGGDDADSGPGGSGLGRRGPGGSAGPNGDPVWWPEFERQFAAYVVCRSAGVT